MKKLIFLVLFFPLFSCNDWLDVESEVSVTYRNYFQSEQDIEDIFITILGNEKKIFAPLSQEPFDWTGMYCDDVADGVKGFRNLEWSAYSSSLGNYTNWGGFYSIIYLANMLEENRHRFQNVGSSLGRGTDCPSNGGCQRTSQKPGGHCTGIRPSSRGSRFSLTEI